MWTCPLCHRNFRVSNQTHSCYSTSVEDHLEGKNDVLRECYFAFMDLIKDIGDFDIDPVKSTILLKKKSAFCAIKIKQKWIDIHFMYHSELIDPLIHKSTKFSKCRWAHFLRLTSKEDLHPQMIDWIKEARDFADEK